MSEQRRETERHQPANLDKELMLWAAYRTSNGHARDREKLFRHYQPLIRRIASSHFRTDVTSPVEYDDLFQLACTGLLESIDRFQPDLGVPFRYFASRRIRGAILNGIAIHSEVNQQIGARRRMARERLASLQPQENQPANINEALIILGEIAADLALGLMLEESRLYSTDGTDPSKSPFETIAWKQMIKRVRQEIDALPERERKVMLWHYIDGIRFDQIGEILELSKGRISQVHKAAIALLRKRLLNAGQFRIEG